MKLEAQRAFRRFHFVFTYGYFCDYTADEMRPALNTVVKGAAAQKRSGTTRSNCDTVAVRQAQDS